ICDSFTSRSEKTRRSTPLRQFRSIILSEQQPWIRSGGPKIPSPDFMAKVHLSQTPSRISWIYSPTRRRHSPSWVSLLLPRDGPAAVLGFPFPHPIRSRQSEGDGAARHLTSTAVEVGAWEAATRSSGDGGGLS
ncbi:hypothetical protein CRG98_050444, partial [Punica granatum]